MLAAAVGAGAACSHPSLGGPPVGNTAGNAGAAGQGGSAEGGAAGGGTGDDAAAGAGGAAGSSQAGGASGGAAGIGGAAGPNLITNGDFSNGQTDWAIAPGSPAGTLAVTNGQLCVTIAAGVGPVIIGWATDPTTAGQIQSGVTYLFSYQAVVTAGTLSLFEVKIAEATGQFTTDKEFDSDMPTTTMMTFSHTFTATMADPQAGGAVMATAGGSGATVCLDNVSLVAQ